MDLTGWIVDDLRLHSPRVSAYARTIPLLGRGCETLVSDLCGSKILSGEVVKTALCFATDH